MHQEQRDCNYAGARLPTDDFEIAEKGSTHGQKEPAEKSQQERQGSQPPLEQRFQKVVVGAIDELRNESGRAFVERIYARKGSHAGAERSKSQNRAPSLAGDDPT